MKKKGKIHYPWVTFKLDGGHYCISSKYVSNMVLEHNFQPLPDNDPYMLGVISMHDTIIPVVDMRKLLNLQTPETMLSRFEEMKDSHRLWVETLKESVDENIPFTLAHNPKECEFGKWMSTFESDNNSLNYVVRQIQPLHEELHSYADLVKHASLEGNFDKVQMYLEQAHTLSNDRIIPLMDNLIKVYADANKGILIVLELSEKWLAILVDEISGVVHFERVTDQTTPDTFGDSQYITSIITNDGIPYLKLNIYSLMEVSP